jgi:hypothetical protein
MTAEQNRSYSKSFTEPAKVHGQGMALARYLLPAVLFMLTCIEHHTNRRIIHTDNLSYVRQWQEDENELLTDGLFHRICFESFEPPEFYFLTG